ncbi:hypothetical protein J6590_098271 [Homalodisca vitripennis]|nr:hypothetical protein J6590_098271 [Homalodisca vitripennis]
MARCPDDDKGSAVAAEEFIAMGLRHRNPECLQWQWRRSQQWVFVTGTANGGGCAWRGGVTVCTARMASWPEDDKESAVAVEEIAAMGLRHRNREWWGMCLAG